MNIFQKITVQSLKKNRTRTVVTIIGVILSAAMITGVTTFIASLQNFLIENVIATEGDWHVEFRDVSPEFAGALSADTEVENYALNQNIGYSLLEGGKNEYKPYLFLSAFSDEAFATLPLHLLAGRLPQNDRELLISEHIESNAMVSHKIGDQLVLDIGERRLENESLGQSNPYVSEDDNGTTETFVSDNDNIKTYTVVGICSRPHFENYTAPGYSVITKLDPSTFQETDVLNAFVKLKDPAAVYTYTETTGQNLAYTYNSDLLRFLGISDNKAFNKILFSLGAILIALIMIGSVLLIHNSFSISVSERTRQFGILSSVGATKKQITKSVLFEGVCIGCIGIPLGILAGIGGIGVTLALVRDKFESLSTAAIDVPMTLSLSIPSLLTAGLVGMVTIMLSAYIPAQKAAKVSAMDAIRQTADIKIQAKKVKTSSAVQKLFGLEGTLALKNLKRNKKRYRSTVISLFVSVVLFISASAFGLYLKKGAENSIGDLGYDIAFSTSRLSDEGTLNLYEQFKHMSGITDSGYHKKLSYKTQVPAEILSERYLTERASPLETTREIYADLYLVDDTTFLGYAADLGLNPLEYTNPKAPKFIAMAKVLGFDINSERYVSYEIFKENAAMSLLLTDDQQPSGEKPATIDIDITAFADKMPDNLSQSLGSGIMIFAPYSFHDAVFPLESRSENIILTFLSSTPEKTAAEISALLKDQEIYSNYYLYNIAEMQKQNRDILLVVNVFTYGFIVLISLITIANVFNTISTNIHLRRREFAMLRSIGMTDRSFRKMMNFECLFYGIKALLYGLPAAFFITYFIYRSLMTGVDTPFTMPWTSVGISICSVFLVVFVTMLYSISKVNKENTVEALKSELM